MRSARQRPRVISRTVVAAPGIDSPNRLWALEQALLSAPGISGIDIDLRRQQVTIDYDPESFKPPNPPAPLDFT